MKYPLTVIMFAASAFLIASKASAQYVGPNTIPLATAQQLAKSGKDDQYAVLRGHLISHDGGENYTFEDETGRIAVEISSKYMPLDRKFDAQTRLELTGKLDRDFSKTEFEAKQIRFLE